MLNIFNNSIFFLASFQVLNASCGGRLYKCSKCSHVFGRKCHLIRHLERHEDVRVMYFCKMCSKSFTRKDSLERHEKNHCKISN